MATADASVASHSNMFSGALEGRSGSSETSPQQQHQQQQQQPHLNPRSCVTCRKRKVRCDKHEPCSNCVKAHIDCFFPAPGRAPRKARKPPDVELLKRLKRLEGVVQSLGAQVDESGDVATMDSALKSARHPSRTSSVSEDLTGKHESDADALPLGKLVISDGKSRYVNSSYWSMVGNEIADIRDILDRSDSEDEDHLSPESQNEYDVHAKSFVFGFSSLAVDMKRLYPSPSQIFIIWEIFKENIDPILKVLHCPSVKNLILKAAVNTDDLSRPAEALFFAICFGVTVSMTDSQCQSLLGESKEMVRKKYQFATEQALARADFLNSSSLMVLQAFTFFLICLRYYDDSKSVWALGGLAIHQAYTQGLHRDGTHFGLDPFEIEMRRRLWYHIAMLDVRAAEDNGTELRAPTSNYDTKFPSNVNDDEIWPGMPHAPTSHDGATDMMFCLVRFELNAMARKLNFYNPNITGLDDTTIHEREQLIDECHREIEDKYIKHCNMNTPIHWVAAIVSRLILAKMWLRLHHSRLLNDKMHEKPELRDRVFNTSVEVIEFGHLLENNENTSKWGWLFRTHMQWHAVAYVLAELGTRPPGPDVDRAWQIVESVYGEAINSKKQRGMLWKPIQHLMTKARRHQAQSSTQSSSAEPALSAEWLTTNSNGVAVAIDTFGMDYAADFAMNNENPFQNSMAKLPVSDLDPFGVVADPTLVPDTTPPSQQGSTPDFLQWEGWSPGVGSFNVGPTTQPFEYSYNKPQEWY